ncbi:hypothetical protein ACPOL_5695 [Acidisarcina polymorpha]|uniref:Uncharacterized protein n=1 Tax=Acidisarcina polymorpha TaxID=2211140 RepID=A0A2Z5G787_9BACT|nr:hypothetical protein ACPOL_5695 [Acidisarcina polymorpha]
MLSIRAGSCAAVIKEPALHLVELQRASMKQEKILSREFESHA